MATMELKSEMQATCIKESHFIQGQGKYQDESESQMV